MSTKLLQKKLFKGTREFEIVDDAVNIRIKTLFKEVQLSVVLSILNPDPVINKSYLDFHSRVKCGPLISLFINEPNTQEFNAFVSTLRQRAREEYNRFTGINANPQTSALSGNSYDEPPEFEDAEQALKVNTSNVNVESIDNTIKMIQTYLDIEDTKPFITALEALKAEPQNEARLRQVVDAFNALGNTQGAVLTYAPYVITLLSDDPFGNK